MTIKLPANLERYVQQKVASGEYATPDAVLAKALEVMRNVEQMLPSAEDDLRREIDLGLEDVAAGRVSDWDVEELKEDLRRHVRAKKESKKKAS